MKRNKKGFTLIELLAVIVILAIIALIAVPTIMNIINKANKSAFKDTAYGIISAGELYFSEQQLEVNGMESDKTFDLATDVNVEGGLQIKGEVPYEGTLVVNTKGQIALSISNGRYCITKKYDDNDITVTEDTNCYFPYSLPALVTTSELLGVTEINSCVEKGKVCEVNGTDPIAFAIKVNEDKTYKFYVISDDGDKVTLIMDRNIGSKVAWVSKSDYTKAGGSETDYGTTGNNNKGPITVLNYLNRKINSETETWTNIAPIESYEYVNNLNGTTNTYGYQKLTITNGVGLLTSQDGTTTNLTGTMRARLLTYEEVNTIKTNNNGAVPTWLYENLSS